MKPLILFVSLLAFQASFSQVVEDKKAAKQLIEDFYEAFHKRDAKTLKTYAHHKIKMHSVIIDSQGSTSLSSETYSNFLDYLVAIPASTKFKEKLHNFEITLNGMIGTVSAAYSFYINDQLSHCGVNTFQLIKSRAGEWKIIYFVDTRSKLGCE